MHELITICFFPKCLIDPDKLYASKFLSSQAVLVKKIYRTGVLPPKQCRLRLKCLMEIQLKYVSQQLKN